MNRRLITRGNENRSLVNKFPGCIVSRIVIKREFLYLAILFINKGCFVFINRHAFRNDHLVRDISPGFIWQEVNDRKIPQIIETDGYEKYEHY